MSYQIHRTLIKIKINENEDVDDAAEKLINTILGIAIKQIPNSNMPRHLEKATYKSSFNNKQRKYNTMIWWRGKCIEAQKKRKKTLQEYRNNRTKTTTRNFKKKIRK